MKQTAHMDLFYERTKDLFWIALTGLASIFSPVKNILLLLLLSFIFNVIMGIRTDIRVNKAKFSIKKAFNAISQLSFYAVCVVFLDYGSRLIDEPTIAVTSVKWLTYIVVYFYLTNIFKNAKQVYPQNQAINFIYELLSTEIFDRLKSIVGYRSESNRKQK